MTAKPPTAMHSPNPATLTNRAVHGRVARVIGFWRVWMGLCYAQAAGSDATNASVIEQRGWNMSEKTCGVCKQTKDVGEFYKRKSSKDGLCWLCKQCDREQSRRYKAAKRKIKVCIDCGIDITGTKAKRCHDCSKTARREYAAIRYKAHQTARREYAARWYKAQREYAARWFCCAVLNKHHEDLKDDPERLSTGFIKELSKLALLASQGAGRLQPPAPGWVRHQKPECPFYLGMEICVYCIRMGRDFRRELCPTKTRP